MKQTWQEERQAVIARKKEEAKVKAEADRRRRSKAKPKPAPKTPYSEIRYFKVPIVVGNVRLLGVAEDAPPEALRAYEDVA